MTVSPYLQEVLRAATETLPLMQTWDDRDLPIQTRHAANIARQRRLEQEWAAAAAALPEIRWDLAESDIEWASWLEAGGDRTAAYRTWNASPAKYAIPDELSELGVLLSDARLSNPAAVYLAPISERDADTADIKPALVDLNPLTRQPQPNVVAVHEHAEERAAARAAEVLEDIDLVAPISDWDLWRLRGGDTEPVFLAWLSDWRASRSGPGTATLPTAPPGPPGPSVGVIGVSRYANDYSERSAYPGAIILISPPPVSAKVTHLDIVADYPPSRLTTTPTRLTIPYDGSRMSHDLLLGSHFWRMASSYGPFRFKFRWRNVFGASPEVSIVVPNERVRDVSPTDPAVGGALAPVWIPDTNDRGERTNQITAAADYRQPLTSAAGKHIATGCVATVTQLTPDGGDGRSQSKTLYNALDFDLAADRSTPRNIRAAISIGRYGGWRRGFGFTPDARHRVDYKTIDETGAVLRTFATFTVEPPEDPWTLFT